MRRAACASILAGVTLLAQSAPQKIVVKGHVIGQGELVAIYERTAPGAEE